MNSKRERLKHFRLYAITDLKEEDFVNLSFPRKRESKRSGFPTLSEKNVKFFPKSAPRVGASVKAFGNDMLERIQAALRGGVDVLQLRSKTLSDRALLRLAKKLRVLTNRMKKLFIVNDRVDLMLASGADGVHLGQDDLPMTEARKLIRDRTKIIGRSTHSLSQALQAEREGADYIGFGPIFETPTKPAYPPVGLNSIREAASRIKIPVVCIGGIDASNVERVIRAGATRVAVVRAIFAASDPFQAAKELKGKLCLTTP
jgi:thiamine-phosphate pyrophosphorylase